MELKDEEIQEITRLLNQFKLIKENNNNKSKLLHVVYEKLEPALTPIVVNAIKRLNLTKKPQDQLSRSKDDLPFAVWYCYLFCVKYWKPEEQYQLKGHLMNHVKYCLLNADKNPNISELLKPEKRSQSYIDDFHVKDEDPEDQSDQVFFYTVINRLDSKGISGVTREIIIGFSENPDHKEWKHILMKEIKFEKSRYYKLKTIIDDFMKEILK